MDGDDAREPTGDVARGGATGGAGAGCGDADEDGDGDGDGGREWGKGPGVEGGASARTSHADSEDSAASTGSSNGVGAVGVAPFSGSCAVPSSSAPASPTSGAPCTASPPLSPEKDSQPAVGDGRVSVRGSCEPSEAGRRCGGSMLG